MSNTLFYSLCALGGLLGGLAAWHSDLYDTFVARLFIWSSRRCYPVRVFVKGEHGEPGTLILGNDVQTVKADALRFATSGTPEHIE